MEIQKSVLVSIQGWEMEVLDGPHKIQHDILGEVLQFRGIWLTEPERGLVTVLTRPESIFYLEITESELPIHKNQGRRSKITPLRRYQIQRDDEDE